MDAALCCAWSKGAESGLDGNENDERRFRGAAVRLAMQEVDTSGKYRQFVVLQV